MERENKTLNSERYEVPGEDVLRDVTESSLKDIQIGWRQFYICLNRRMALMVFGQFRWSGCFFRAIMSPDFYVNRVSKSQRGLVFNNAGLLQKRTVINGRSLIVLR